MQFLKNTTNTQLASFHGTILLVSLIAMQIGCKKLIEIEPPSEQSTGDVVFSSTASAMEALTGVYASIREDRIFGGSESVTIGSSMLSDELQKSEVTLDPFYTNALTGQDFIWVTSYRDYLYRLNSIIEGVSFSRTIPISAKNILLGEAKFMRAYIYFYLVNYYGDVPLVLTTSLEKNRVIGRALQAEVYVQIIKDLSDAQSLLRDDFLKPDLATVTLEKIRPNKTAATALLSRVYLYLGSMGDEVAWSKAEVEATKIISDGRYQLVTDDINNVFLKNSTEALWQLQPQTWDFGTSNVPDANFLIPYPTGNLPNFIITPFLESAFEAGDLRYTSWLSVATFNAVDYIFPCKYKQNQDPQPQMEYIMVLRLAEQYLIRAEARANQGKLTGPDGAQNDINVIRSRAGLPNTTAATQSEMIDAVLQERRVEFFTEGGHRWLDLKRTGKINDVMNIICPLKGGTWLPYKSLLPIPITEFELNPSLVGHQNPGYLER